MGENKGHDGWNGLVREREQRLQCQDGWNGFV